MFLASPIIFLSLFGLVFLQRDPFSVFAVKGGLPKHIHENLQRKSPKKSVLFSSFSFSLGFFFPGLFLWGFLFFCFFVFFSRNQEASKSKKLFVILPSFFHRMNVTTSTHAGYTARRKPPTAEGLPYTEDHSARFEVGEYRFFCVFDGHGGDETSSALARIVPRLARELFESMESVEASGSVGSVEAGLLLLFERIDAEIASSGLAKGGATCNVTVVHAPTMVMTVASLGDSPTLVYERHESHESHERQASQESYVLAFRTKDQDCADEEEQARLRALGLYVFEQRVVAPDGSTHATGVFRCRTVGGTDTSTMSSFGDAAHDDERRLDRLRALELALPLRHETRRDDDEGRAREPRPRDSAGVRDAHEVLDGVRTLDVRARQARLVRRAQHQPDDTARFPRAGWVGVERDARLDGLGLVQDALVARLHVHHARDGGALVRE
jgi:serine/threonine protein phosphatase PrpC